MMLPLAELLHTKSDAGLDAAQQALHDTVSSMMHSAPATSKERQMVTVPQFAAWAAQQSVEMSPEMHAIYVMAIIQVVFEAKLKEQQQAQSHPTAEFDLQTLFEELDAANDIILQKLRQQQLQQDSNPVDTLMSLFHNQFRQAFNGVLGYLAWMMQNHPQQVTQSPAFHTYQRMMRMAPGMFPNGMADYVDAANMNTMLAVQAMQMAQLAGAATEQANGAVLATPVVPYAPGGAPVSPFAPARGGNRAGFTEFAGTGGNGYMASQQEVANNAALAAQQVTPGATLPGMGHGGSNSGSGDASSAGGLSAPIPVPTAQVSEKERRKRAQRLGMDPFAMEPRRGA